MIRSLWTGASGMISQQQNIDLISHNITNVNTNGYKKERMEFKTLLYETMKRADLDPANTAGRPVNLQIGHGVRPIATSRVFTMGNLNRTDSNQDFAIEGDGFFVVRRAEGDIKYSKDGAFKLGTGEEGLMLTTAEGYPILGVDDQPIILPDGVSMKDVTVSEVGVLNYLGPDNQTTDLGLQIKIVQFPNVQGLEAVGSNLLGQTVASGEAIAEVDGTVTRPSRIIQGVLELSNVQIAEEMINLIVAQRAYDLSSKAITTSDEMLQTANGLKR